MGTGLSSVLFVRKARLITPFGRLLDFIAREGKEEKEEIHFDR